MKFTPRPVGTFNGDGTMEVWEIGDTITFHTGELVMVTAVGSVGYRLKSLNGRGSFLLTPGEISMMRVPARHRIDA